MFKVMSNFKKDEEGAALVFVGVCLAVLIGFAALTFDLGRVAATQSDMQAYADHVALAAAGELDGTPGSRVRARAAAEQAIQDRQAFGDIDQTLDGTADFTLRFLRALPPTDREYFDPTDDLNDSAFLATSDFDATMVEVTTREESVFLPFFRAFRALSSNETIDGRGVVFARAVAGYTQYACDIAVLMFCMPSNPAALVPGTSIRLRTGASGSAAWGPGNFGFLDPVGDPNEPTSQSAIDPNGDCASRTGADLYACLIASSGNRTRCFAQRGVDMNTGQAVGIENAVFNTRFDMYNSTMSSNKSDSVFAPAMHRVTGLVPKASDNGNDNGNNGGDNGNGGGGGVCLGNNVDPSSDSMAFPPDPCHASGACAAFGGTDWNRDLYASKNYKPFGSETGPTFSQIATEGGALGDMAEQLEPGQLASDATRFQVYLREHEMAMKTFNEASGTFGNGLPSFNNDYEDNICAQTTPSDNPNRRVFIIAGINCDESNGGTRINGAKKGVPVDEYYEVFLMEPVGTGNGGASNFDLFVEMIGPAGGDGSGTEDDGGIFRVVVELLR